MVVLTFSQRCHYETNHYVFLFCWKWTNHYVLFSNKYSRKFVYWHEFQSHIQCVVKYHCPLGFKQVTFVFFVFFLFFEERWQFLISPSIHSRTPTGLWETFIYTIQKLWNYIFSPSNFINIPFLLPSPPSFLSYRD